MVLEPFFGGGSMAVFTGLGLLPSGKDGNLEAEPKPGRDPGTRALGVVAEWILETLLWP